jgi:hypothetical protein
MNTFGLAIFAIIVIAVLYEVYRPLGLTLAVIALVTMLFRGVK